MIFAHVLQGRSTRKANDLVSGTTRQLPKNERSINPLSSILDGNFFDPDGLFTMYGQ